MAFLAVLQRLTPGERAVLLLRGAFDLDQTEVAALLQTSEATCCRLLSRARGGVASVRRVLEVSREEHHRVLHAFVQALDSGKLDLIMALLAEDATLILDTGPDGRSAGCTHDIGRPVSGPEQVAAFLAGVAREGTRLGTLHICMLNGQRAVVYVRDRRPRAAMLVAVADGRIRHIFVQTDASRLRNVAPLE